MNAVFLEVRRINQGIPELLLNGLVINVLRMIRLCKEEPALSDQADVLYRKGYKQYFGVAITNGCR